MTKGWVWSGNRASRNGGHKHGFPCLTGNTLRAMCDMYASCEDDWMPCECPGCGAGPMFSRAQHFRLRHTAPEREIINLEASMELRRKSQLPWEPPPPLSPEREAEMKEISQIMRNVHG